MPTAHRVDHETLALSVAEIAALSLAALDEGTLAVLCPPGRYDDIATACRDRFGDASGYGAGKLDSRIAVMPVTEAKGLEFDAVVLAEPAELLDRGDAGLRDLYVALTRATQRLDVVHSGDLPAVLSGLQLSGPDISSASGLAG